MAVSSDSIWEASVVSGWVATTLGSRLVPRWLFVAVESPWLVLAVWARVTGMANLLRVSNSTASSSFSAYSGCPIDRAGTLIS